MAAFFGETNSILKNKITNIFSSAASNSLTWTNFAQSTKGRGFVLEGLCPDTDEPGDRAGATHVTVVMTSVCSYTLR